MENITVFTLALGVAIGHLAFLLKNTEFIAEYATLFKLEKFFLIERYNEWKKNEDNFNEGYPTFIREAIGGTRFKHWAAHLFGCGYCFSTFLCVILSVLSFSWWFPLIGLTAAGIAGIIFSTENLLYKKINS